jgi:D-serine deaminase-like pyridoxal phosphate-dependent protein
MTSRRTFLAANALLAGTLARATKPSFPYTDLEARIGKRDFRDLTKDVLPTPCMVVDLDIFERNLRTMADYSKTVGIHVRPHVKVHKSVDIAKKQIALGALGVTTATIAESELMSGAGIKGVLWTKQPVSKNNLSRAIALSRKDPTFMFVVDDPLVSGWVAEAAAAANTKCRVAASVYAGMARQGIENGKPAVDLAQTLASSKNIAFEGYMAYSGGAAHTKGFDLRRQKSAEDLAGLQQTLELSKKAGLPTNIVSGGSTGTYNIDKDNSLTELECGSYVFMDTGYFAIGGKNKTEDGVYTDFGGSLTVLTTVDSKRHPNLATIDYGNKAMARPTDAVKGKPWLKIGNQGAEYGALKWDDSDRDVKLGDRFEIFCTNLDMSTNCFDRYYVARGEQIVDVWPIMGRSGAAQR